ncbi:MBL fold metallo-hydrolase [Bacterioplanoides sp.]|uniref:MBL fold metallo-hydrolase n=1 Tax=Bacterioplanoides sp. TaxID=2066072 RepID=UPI003AFF8FD8
MTSTTTQHTTIKKTSRMLFSIAAMAFSQLTLAHNHGAAEQTITTEKVRDGIYLLASQRAGNSAVFIGEDGTFMIDDQFASLTAALNQAIRSVGGEQPRFLINTHWHGDHTGGNENFGKDGTIIVAHKNVRERLSSEQFVAAFNMKSPPQPKAALPVITFADEVTFHWNNDDIQVIHTPDAHTDSDSFIYFSQANVIHTGDLFFNGFYPFIDPGSRGNIFGVISAVDKVLTLTNDRTRIIPGHGPVADKQQLMNYRAMLQTAAERIKKLKDAGKTEQQVIAAKPTKDLDAEWGDGFLKPDVWVGIVYQGL